MTASSIIRRFGLAAYLSLCLVAGGASAAGPIANLLLQLIGLAVITALLIRREPTLRHTGRGLALLIATWAVLLVLQIIPLPPGIWSLLPGRGEIARQFVLAGMPLPWLPWSLAVDSTIAVLCSLVVPAAILLLTFRADREARHMAVLAVIAVAAASILLGMLQRFGGEESPLYIYDITNRGSSVGFFSNRNHLATLLLMTLPLLGTLAIARRGASGRVPRSARHVLVAGGVLLLCIGVGAAGSMAGWLLLLPVLFATWALFRRGETSRGARLLLRSTIAVAVLGAVLAIAMPFGLRDFDAKLNTDNPHLRSEATRTASRAALDVFPFGSGGGSFVTAYPAYEDARTIDNEYLNHVHDDYIEIWLEYGLAGILLIGAALWLWLSRARALWRLGSDASDLQRAAFVAIGVAAAHSLVDYPVRTAAIAALLAFVAALTVTPPAPSPVVAERARSARSRRRADPREPHTMIHIDLADPPAEPTAISKVVHGAV